MKNGMNILKDNHLKSILSQFGGAAIALVSFMILARSLSVEDFGNWALFLALITFVEMIKAGFVQNAFIKYASGNQNHEFQALLGSAWVFNLIFVTSMGLPLWVASALAEVGNQGVHLFLKYYLIYAVLSSPYFMAQTIAQVRNDFGFVLKSRWINAGLFCIATIVCYLFQLSLEETVWGYLIAFTCSSILFTIKNQSGLETLMLCRRSILKQYWKFGKFHSLAFLGSNLLKSADTFLIGIFLGPTAVAIYSIPLRLVELIEMPLKGALSVAFPTFAKLDNQSRPDALKKALENYIGILSLGYLPFMLALFLFATPLIQLIGGSQYAGAESIFYLFLIYGLLLPFDRLTGIVLDAMGKTRLNFNKVLIMASVNVLGDLLVLYFFQSLEGVAAITILNVFAGAIVGYYYNQKRLQISIRSIFYAGLNRIQLTYQQLKNSQL